MARLSEEVREDLARGLERDKGIPLALARLVADPWWAIPRMTIATKADGVRRIRKLGPAQVRALLALVEHDQVCVVKARQVYVSTLVAAWFSWLMTVRRQPYRTFVLADCEDTTSSLHDMYATFVDNEPRAYANAKTRDNATAVRVAGGGWVQLRMAGGRGAGRGKTYHGLHCTEVGFWKQTSSQHPGATGVDRRTLNAALGAWAKQDPLARYVQESTAAGPGGVFHETVQLAQRSDRWGFVFMPWFDHPEYVVEPPPGWTPAAEDDDYAQRVLDQTGVQLRRAQLYWRRRKTEDEGWDERDFNYEYPNTPDEPFLAAGGLWFDGELSDLLSRWKTALMESPGVSAFKPDLYVAAPYQPGAKYFAGYDTSGGTGRDYAALVIWREDGALAARWCSNRLKPAPATDRVAEVLALYGRPPLLTEKNKYGKACIYRLREVLRYPRMWTHNGEPDGRDWSTDGPSKREILSDLQDLLDWLQPADLFLVNELLTLREDEKGDIRGTPHDDIAIASALAARCGREHFQRAARSPLKKRETRVQAWKRMAAKR